MREAFNTLKRDRIVKRSYLVSCFLLAITFFYTIFLYGRFPPFIPVFNQLPWGMERLGGKVTLFLPIILTGGIILINIIFSQYAYKHMPLIVRMVSITTLFVTLALSIFIIRTSLLVI